MKWVAVLLLSLIITSIQAMEINADPRFITSFMDKTLLPELDILRVTTEISPENNLVFQIKTRGERLEGDHNDYLLLEILHDKAYLFLIPVNKEAGNNILIYENAFDPENYSLPKILENSKKNNFNLRVNRVIRGAEFIVPLAWFNFGADLGFDAYAIQANIQGNQLQINKIYDQARIGNKEIKLFSAITLLNKLCSPKR